MGILLTTFISVTVAIGAAGLFFFGSRLVVESMADNWRVSRALIGGVAGLFIGIVVQHNGWLKLGGDPFGPLQNGWLTMALATLGGALVGYAFGAARQPDTLRRQMAQQQWQAVIFAGPAIAFITMGLVLPSAKTIFISFREGRRGDGAMSLSNYRAIFSDQAFINVDSFDRVFTSRLFVAAMAILLASVLLAHATARRSAGDAGTRSSNVAARVVSGAIAIFCTLAVIGFVEALFRSPNRSAIYDVVLTPTLESRVTLWILVAGLLAATLAMIGRGVSASSTTQAKDVGDHQGVLARKGSTLSSRQRRVTIAAGLLIALCAAAGFAGGFSAAETVSAGLVVTGAAALMILIDINRRVDLLDFSVPAVVVGLIAATILSILATFSTLHSVVANNLWWVATVAGFATVLGLTLAMLADRAGGERVARTLIFLPMAISMVGAAVIWGFVYELKPFGNQTGLANALLQWLGFEPRGFFINSTMIPWNNFWIMLIMVWIQTGFAMVILSAAIKGVPDELLEAARVDGASEAQVFWQITLPQIRTTVVVVVTTLIIIVMKVFDLVKATTEGANRTNVLANEMFDQLRVANFSLSASFAVVIFALVLPVMIFNVRRNLREVSQ